MARKKKGLSAHWRHLIYYIIALGILILAWHFVPSQTAKIVAVWGFFITQLIFNIKGNKKEMTPFFQFANWAYVLLFFFLAISYSASAVHVPEITISTILVMFLVILLITALSNSVFLLKSKTWPFALLTYLALAASVIVLFGFIYAASSTFPAHSIFKDQIQYDGNAWTYVYFSSSMFYSNIVGSFDPQGYSRLFSQVELVLSAIIHIFMLGYVIPGLTKK